MNKITGSTSFNLYPSTAQEAIEQCVLANRILANEGILAEFGQVSIRNPENPNSFFIARRMAAELVTRKDITEIDLSGEKISNSQHEAYRETMLHVEIYKARSDINSICRSHIPELAPFSSTGIPFRPISLHAAMFYDGVPIFSLPTTVVGLPFADPGLCTELAHSLGHHRAIMITCHGNVIVGENVVTLISSCVALRNDAEALYRALTIGKPKYLTKKMADSSLATLLSEQDLTRRWNYWLSKSKDLLPALYW